MTRASLTEAQCQLGDLIAPPNLHWTERHTSGREGKIISPLGVNSLSSPRPYISFVVTARNDDYGGNFLHRMNVFVNQTRLWNKFGLNYELIIVEWNPPPDRPRLKDALAWPTCAQEKVRIIEVTSQIHRSLPRSNMIQLYEFTGKNVGIRRARGAFVLSTNSDILFSAQLTEFLASRRLLRQCFYRTDRYDLDRSIVPLAVPATEQLKFCEKHIARINLRGETIDVHDRRPGNLRIEMAKYHFNRLRRRKLNRIEDTLHTNGSGDFMLMSQDSWNGLRGHPETFVTNVHIDSFMCAMAASSGLKQVILNGPMCAYHQHHESHDEPSEALYSFWVKQARLMLERGKPIIYNTENWGLNELDCNEWHL